MKTQIFIFFILFCGIHIFINPVVHSQQNLNDPPAVIPHKLTLVQATMCEGVNAQIPEIPTIIFSIRLGMAFCFTDFDPVPQQEVIYHNWYRRDNLSAKVKLTLKPPRWSTYSSIQLRKTDKGPWRVEITDAEGNILRILRFSITD